MLRNRATFVSHTFYGVPHSHTDHDINSNFSFFSFQSGFQNIVFVEQSIANENHSHQSNGVRMVLMNTRIKH